MLLLAFPPPNTLFRTAVPQTGPFIPPEALSMLSRRYRPRSVPLTYPKKVADIFTEVWHSWLIWHLLLWSTRVLPCPFLQAFWKLFLIMSLHWWLFPLEYMHCIYPHRIAFPLVSEHSSSSARSLWILILSSVRLTSNPCLVSSVNLINFLNILSWGH